MSVNEIGSIGMATRAHRLVETCSLPGGWTRWPYLHNGAVRTIEELLTVPAQRAKAFHRGSREFVENEMGYADSGSYLLETTLAGNSNAGHNYGTDLSQTEKREL